MSVQYSFSIDNVSGISATKLEQNLDLSDLDNEIYILTNPYYNGAAGCFGQNTFRNLAKGILIYFLYYQKEINCLYCTK